MIDRTGPRSAGAVAAAAALAALCLGIAHGDPAEFKINDEWVVQVDGQPRADAKVFRSGDRFLLEVPSEPTLFLVDRGIGAVFAVRPDQVRRTDGDARLLREQFAWNAPMSRAERGIRFHTGEKEIRLVPAEPKPAEDKGAEGGTRSNPTAADLPRASDPTPPATDMIATPAVPVAAVPVAADQVSACGGTPDVTPPAGMPGAVARDCVSLETRPAAGVPGCTRFVYITNHCDTPVVAQVQRIEHLMTGPLPQAFNVTVRQEEWLGCAWWSGAMAPAQHDILGAAFLETHGRRAAGNRPPGR